jgi:hypothetical protein
MSFTLTGTVSRADLFEPQENGGAASREVLVEGTVDDKKFEVELRIIRDTSPVLFDPLGQVALGQSVTLEVTL